MRQMNKKAKHKAHAVKLRQYVTFRFIPDENYSDDCSVNSRCVNFAKHATVVFKISQISVLAQHLFSDHQQPLILLVFTQKNDTEVFPCRGSLNHKVGAVSNAGVSITRNQLMAKTVHHDDTPKVQSRRIMISVVILSLVLWCETQRNSV